uniref:Uncharacterized protein n=1 Tax=Panagrolaimus sp. PS1159 TaxID=55785 RepID=A0AC35FIW1_9BILA
MAHSSLLNELVDLESSLKGLTDEKRREKIQEHRERLMGIVRIMIRDKIHSYNLLKYVGLGSTSKHLTTMITKFMGFDPFAWFHFSEYGDHNAAFADRAFSNPSIYDAIEKSAEIFIQKGSGHINTKQKNFSQGVNSVKDSDRLAESIISFCKILTAASSGQTLQVIINANEVRVVLAHAIEAILENSKTTESVREKISKPVIAKGQIAWVRYEFYSETSINEACCLKDKRVDVNVKLTYFVFPSEADFRIALRNIEGSNVAASYCIIT